MEKYLGIFVLALLVSVFSCDKDISPDCPECGKKVGKVVERQGTITYDSTAGRYLIHSHIPGTIDAFRAGYLCDLPTAYRETGKRVIVSGTSYETTLRFPTGICCVDENYCLTLSSIKEQ
ncbi:hypothetical protein [Persicitalea jodogahamensis]|uniref:hypothetical protein n=1 Tax=Persicitalea jodogahamensis TaxID=402147 RepID=UPI0016738A20|nr:hypothetical protein [Persicitalea jodogahamensis]